MIKKTREATPSKAIQLSPEISKEKINKTQLGKDITKISTIHTTTYAKTDYIPNPQKNFMQKCKPKGKVFYQVRVGYIFSCFKYKQINSDAANFFKVDTHIVERYCRSIVHVTDHIHQFSEDLISLFEQEADKDLKVAYKALKEFDSTSLLNQLFNYKDIPTIGLLEKQNKLNGINKFNDYNSKRDIKAAEQNLMAISKRKSDKKTVIYFGSTKMANNQRKLKFRLPSQWLAFKVLYMLCDIHNRKAMNVAEKRVAKRVSKQQTKLDIIRLHLEGMPNTEIVKIVNVGRSKVAEIVRKFKRSEIVKKEAIINKGNSIIATKNAKNDPPEPTAIVVGNVRYINPTKERVWAA